MENLQRMNDSTSCASPCNQQHVLTLDVTEIQRRQKQVLSVLILTVITMVVEIVAGHITGSMALQADGYHMGSHAGALGVAFLAYRMMSWERIRSRMNFGSGKILALGGYSNAIALGFVSLWMIIECIERLLSPKAISFDEALAVAVLGLIVNLASAWLLGWEGGVGHHHHGEHHHGEHHHGEHHHGEHHHGEHHHGEHHHYRSQPSRSVGACARGCSHLSVCNCCTSCGSSVSLGGLVGSCYGHCWCACDSSLVLVTRETDCS